MSNNYLYIGIGLDNHFFTLRESYKEVRYGAGCVVNGVFQGQIRVVQTSCHHCNLSQDADAAYAKAVEHAQRLGLELRANPEVLKEELRAIKRATAEQLAERVRKAAQQEAEEEAARVELEQFQLDLIKQGIWPICRGGIIRDWNAQTSSWGPYRLTETPVKIRDIDIGRLNWWARLEEPNTVVGKALQDYIRTQCADLILPDPVPGYVGDVGERRTFTATVVKTAYYDGAYGRTYVTTLVDYDTGKCLVVKSGAWKAALGKTLSFTATIKAHGEFRGQDQTQLQRVKEVVCAAA